MNKLYTQVKFCTVILFALVLVFGCKKQEITNSSQKEASQIKSWVETMVKANNVVDSTTSGLHYIISKVGSGANVKAGDSLTVQYTGKFLDGTVFDSSASFKYVQNAVNQRMIPGWEEGIEKLSKGGAGLFLIPSNLAYGSNGYYTIPPYTPLVFTLEVIDIK